jgi:hypothetical protein
MLDQSFLEQNKTLLQPHANQGQDASTQLRYLMGIPEEGVNKKLGAYGSMMQPFNNQALTRDPSYQFRFNEGQKALDASAAARGGALSGANIKDAMNYGQGAASQEYGNAFNRYNQQQENAYNRLLKLLGMGQEGATNIAKLQADAGARQGDYITGGASAKAAGTKARGEAFQSGLSSVFGSGGPFGGSFF